MLTPPVQPSSPVQPTPVLIVGMVAEARIARVTGWHVGVGGDGGAAAAARSAMGRGGSALISLGLAGGLDPDLQPGQVVVPAMVIDEAGIRHACDPALSARLGGQDGRLMLGYEHAVATADAKRRLWRETGAAAVDMESGAVARVATEHGVPFAVLRVICDPAERDLPQAALVALDRSGGIGLARVIASVLRHPGQVPALLRLTADARAARRALLARVRAIR